MNENWQTETCTNTGCSSSDQCNNIDSLGTDIFLLILKQVYLSFQEGCTSLTLDSALDTMGHLVHI
jgi:hypothetical protein